MESADVRPSRVTFSIIVPTSGRPTLASALESVTCQIAPGDEILVVCNDDNDFGNAARNDAIERARGSHLIFLDDDDEYLPGALASMRRLAAQHPDRVVLFSQYSEIHGDGTPATAGSVFPNLPGKVGRFRPADPSILRPLRPNESIEHLSVRWGDHEFMRSTVELLGDEPIRVPLATYVIRPEKSAWRRLRWRLRLRTRTRAALARLPVRR